MNQQLEDAVIRMAWEDRTSFDEIHKRTGMTEAEVIKIMRTQLRPRSFRLWRKRVSGRITKHAKRFEQSRQQLGQSPTRFLLDEAGDR